MWLDSFSLPALPLLTALFLSPPPTPDVALQHVSRVCRVLKMPGGHALLSGVGGSGRQSVAVLATYIADYKLTQVELSKSYGKAEWRDDLKKLIMDAGAKGFPTASSSLPRCTGPLYDCSPL